MENGTDQQPEEMNNPAPPPAPAPVTRPDKPKRRKLMMIVAGGAVLLLLGAGAAYWFLMRDKKEPAQTNTQTQNQPDPVEEIADPTPVQYKSEKLNIELTHRKDWKLKEAADGELAITSPSTSYSKADGQAATGPFTVKIRKGVPDAMKATIEKAMAPRASEVIAYAEPTEEQREYTNLSFAGTKDYFNFFIITGNTEFKPGNNFAYALAMDGEFYLIAGGYGTDPDGSLTFDSVPKDQMDSEALEQAIDIVESLKIY